MSGLCHCICQVVLGCGTLARTILIVYCRKTVITVFSAVHKACHHAWTIHALLDGDNISIVEHCHAQTQKDTELADHRVLRMACAQH